MTMLLALVALLVGAAVGWLSGRRLPGDGTAALAQWWRVPAVVAAGAALVLTGERGLEGRAGLAVVAAGYALLIAFAVLNSRRPGLAMLAVGLLTNLVVVLADSGMPVRGQLAGVQIGGHHHGLSTRDHLGALADTIRLAPLGETVSPGDVLAAAGGGTAMFFWLEQPAQPERRRRAGSRRRRGDAARHQGPDPARRS